MELCSTLTKRANTCTADEHKLAFGRLVQWLVQNRRGYAWLNASTDKMINDVSYHAARWTIVTVQDSEENFIALVTYDVQESIRALEIENILVTNPSGLVTLLGVFVEFFPGYSLIYKHKKKPLVCLYPDSVEKLIKKLWVMIQLKSSRSGGK